MCENLAHFSRLSSAENVEHVKGIRGEDIRIVSRRLVLVSLLCEFILLQIYNWEWILNAVIEFKFF